jgi:uncharacterized protein HemY
MRILFALLTLLLLAVALGWGLQQSPGEVAFTYRGWIIQTSLVVFVIIAVVLFLLAYVLIRMLQKLLRLPADLRRWSEHRQRGKLSAAEAEAERLSYYAGLLRQTGSEPGRKALDGVWRKIPQKLKKESSLIGAYVNERLRHADSSDCEPVLRRALKRRWDPELVRLFGLVEGGSLKRQLEFAEERLTRSPGDPALLLALGRLCKRNRLWGKARSYLEQSIQAGQGPAACRELATLLDQQGEHDAARLYLQQGLNLAVAGQESGETGTAPATVATNRQLTHAAGLPD